MTPEPSGSITPVFESCFYEGLLSSVGKLYITFKQEKLNST